MASEVSYLAEQPHTVGCVQAVPSYESATFDNIYLRPEEEVRWKQAVGDAQSDRATGRLLDYLYDAGDTYTVEHSQRVGQLNAAIAVRMECDDQTVRDAAISGFVHDVGKWFFQHIIHIDGKLSDDQFQQIKLHAPYGAQLVAASGLKRLLVHATGNHHGYQSNPYPTYPDALYRVDQIGPLSPGHMVGTGLAAADTFDAMRSVRPGRANPLPLHDALQAVDDMAVPRIVKLSLRGLFDGAADLAEAA